MNTVLPSGLLIYLALLRILLLRCCYPEFFVLYWCTLFSLFWNAYQPLLKGLELVLSQDTVQVDDHVTVVCEEELEGGAMVTTMEELFSPSFHAGVSKAYKWLLVNLQKLSHFDTVRATCCFSLRQVNEPEFRWHSIVKSFFLMYYICYHVQHMSKFAKLTRLPREFFTKITELRKRLDRATYCLYTPKFEARLFWSPPSWWDHLARHSSGSVCRKSLLPSEPSMFYRCRCFYILSSHRKVISWVSRMKQ